MGNSIRVLSAVFLNFCVATTASAAVYNMTFTGLWEDAHVSSGSLPGSAHYTTLIGATHKAGEPLWAPGELATPGIENVAEVGSTFQLAQEISALKASGSVKDQISLGGINSFPDSRSAEIEVFASHDHVTLISMIAPSPDWFVGVYDVALRDASGWIDSLSIDLHPWDAGTEEGDRFSLSNAASNPHQPIALLQANSFNGSPVIGTLSFDLVAVPLPGAALLFASAFAVMGLVRGKSGAASDSL